MSLRVLNAQGQAILVDRGRSHAQSDGLSQSGPLDEYSFLWANRLLGNNANAAMLEITLGNLQFTCTQACMLAITGANIEVSVNQQAQKNWHSFWVKPGDTITIGFYQGQGTRLYLAVAGGFNAPLFYQSKCCVLREKLGGHNNGQALQQGDILASRGLKLLPSRATPEFLQHLPENTQKIRFIPSYQFGYFNHSAQQKFSGQNYKLSPLIDRMGFRLQGEAIDLPKLELNSEGIALGSIQISRDGLPMVLMCDRQSIGGYLKIGVVYRVDLGLLAQLAPGQSVRFIEGDIDEAWQLQQQREQFFNNSASYSFYTREVTRQPS